MRPPFIRVAPADVEQYGPHAAILMSHIKFRCESDGPGRVNADGVRWWRVSLGDIAQETGLSVRGVRTALTALRDTVLAKHFKPLSNQARAYRVAAHQNGAELPDVEIDKCSDLPVGESDISDGDIDISRSQKRQGSVSISTSALSPENLEKEENASAGRAQTDQPSNGSPQLTPTPATPIGTDHAPYGAGLYGKAVIRPLASSTQDERRWLELANTLPMQAPRRTCTQHPHWSGTHRCGDCGNDRNNFDRWRAANHDLAEGLQRVADQSIYVDQKPAIDAHRRRRRELARTKSPT